MNKIRFKYEYGLIWNENGEKFDVNECDGRRLVCDKLNEQQATITKLKELNDDKGKRIISLIRTNKTLKEENEQLRKELNNFKPVMFQDVRKGTVILYSKGGTDEQSSLKVKASSKTVKDD